MDAAHPARIEPEEPMHQILNLPEFGTRAVSVHVNAPPLSTYKVYDAKTGVSSAGTLNYWSE
jgi:hypothetical protein